MARMINAVAWKMPLPAPAWLAELQERNNVRPLLKANQHQTASYWEDGMRDVFDEVARGVGRTRSTDR